MKPIFKSLVLLILIGFGLNAWADVIIQKKTTFEGMMGLGNTERTETEYVRVDRSCSESSGKSSGGLLGGAGKGQGDIQITRLDQGLIWQINSKKKSYKEIPFESFKEMMAKAQESEGKMDESEPDDSTYKWTVTIETLPEMVELSGFNCQNIVAKAEGVNRENPDDKIRMTMKYWMGQDVPGIDELNQFYKNYAKMMGIEDYWGQQNANPMTGKYIEHFGDLNKKLLESGGFPVKVAISLEKSAEIEGDKRDADAAAKAMGKLGGLFGKKQGNNTKSPDGMSIIMSTTTEVLGIKSAGTDDGKFEVPAGYKMENK